MWDLSLSAKSRAQSATVLWKHHALCSDHHHALMWMIDFGTGDCLASRVLAGVQHDMAVIAAWQAGIRC